MIKEKRPQRHPETGFKEFSRMVKPALNFLSQSGWEDFQEDARQSLDYETLEDDLKMAGLIYRRGLPAPWLDEHRKEYEISTSSHPNRRLLEFRKHLHDNPGLRDQVVDAYQRRQELDESIPQISRKDFKWAMIRMDDSQQNRLIGMLPHNPRHDDLDRDKKLLREHVQEEKTTGN